MQRLTHRPAIYFILLVLFTAPVRATLAHDYYSPYNSYRSLPNAIDIMETGLYWLQAWSGPENIADPASLVSLMEQQIAHHFDFGHIAQQTAGAWYINMNIMDRAHFQNRIRDYLFSELAHMFGLYDNHPPSFRPLPPVRTGLTSMMIGGEILRANGIVTRIYFHLYRAPRGWRIYDVSSNGMLITTRLREEFIYHKNTREDFISSAPLPR